MVVLHLMAPNAGSQETSEPTLPAARLIGHPYFEPSVSKLQRDTIMAILPRICLVKWKTFSVTEDGTVEWNPGKDRGMARLNGGRTAEVILRRHPGNTSEPIVVKNLKYQGAPRKAGIILMPNEV